MYGFRAGARAVCIRYSVKIVRYMMMEHSSWDHDLSFVCIFIRELYRRKFAPLVANSLRSERVNF